MLRRDPTRIELRTEDMADFERAREEYLESLSTATRISDPSKRQRTATTATTTRPPPPTPASRDQRDGTTGIGPSGSGSGSGGSGSRSNTTGGGSGSSRDPPLDPAEAAQQERKGKSTRERILGS